MNRKHAIMNHRQRLINNSNFSARIRSIGTQSSIEQASPRRLRYLTSNKNKRRKSMSKLFNAAHETTTRQTFLTPQFSEFFHSIKPSNLKSEKIPTFHPQKTNQFKTFTISPQFSITIKGESTLSALIRNFQEPNTLTEILQKQSEEIQVNILRKQSNSVMSLLQTMKSQQKDQNK